MVGPALYNSVKLASPSIAVCSKLNPVWMLIIEKCVCTSNKEIRFYCFILVFSTCMLVRFTFTRENKDLRMRTQLLFTSLQK